MKRDYLSDRLQALRGQLEKTGAQGMLIGSNANRRWLSGFRGSSGWLLVTHEKALLGTDFRYWEQAREQAPHFNLVKLSSDKTHKDLVLASAVESVVFEAQHLTVREFRNLQDVEGINWLPREGVVEDLRASKDESELDAIKVAAGITDDVMGRVGEMADIGMTEASLAWELEKAMRELGATGVTFPVIVASGPNAALPHHSSEERQLQRGEILLIDMGASFAGYGSDLTRTFYIGKHAEARFEKLYNIVAGAQEAAIQGLRPDLTGREADAIARNLIDAAGYGDQFGHSLGHGLGLEGHEEPRLSATRSDTPLAPGMVVTVEPGIYIPGWGGIRIEDLVLITDSGAEMLSRCPKDLLLNL